MWIVSLTKLCFRSSNRVDCINCMADSSQWIYRILKKNGKKHSTRTLSLCREYKEGARDWEKTTLNYRNRLSDWVVLTKCKFQFKIDYNDNWIKTNGKTVEPGGVRSMYGWFIFFMLRWFNMAHSVLLISGAGLCTTS